MKTYNNIYPEIYSFEALHSAYLRARRGKRHQAEVLRFESDLEGNLIQLQNELIWHQYHTGPYSAFHVHEPKKRLVAALPFRDRVVQHSLVAAIEPIWESRFIRHSYACRRGFGMHAGADQAQRWLREVQATHGRAYVLKADVASYFASIDHDVLYGLLARRLRCRPTLELIRHILGTWRPGLPIGNLTSQLWANVYLHALDEHVKQGLGVRRYMRYMDDWLIVHHDKAYLHALRTLLARWLQEHLGLALNRKTQVFPVGRYNGRGLDFLGYRIWPGHRRLRKDSVKRMKRRLSYLQAEYGRGRVSLSDVGQRIRSWIGHASHADSLRLRQALLDNAAFRRDGQPPNQQPSAQRYVT